MPVVEAVWCCRDFLDDLVDLFAGFLETLATLGVGAVSEIGVVAGVSAAMTIDPAPIIKTNPMTINSARRIVSPVNTVNDEEQTRPERCYTDERDGLRGGAREDANRMTRMARGRLGCRND